MPNNGTKWWKGAAIILVAVSFFIGVGINWGTILALDDDFKEHVEDYEGMEKRDDRQDNDITELKGDIKEIRNSTNRIERKQESMDRNVQEILRKIQ